MEKDFLAGQGERERITSIQFCSAALCLPHDSPATHSSPAGGSARCQHPVAPRRGSCSSSVVAGTWLHRGHRAPAAPRLRPPAPGMRRAAGLWWLKQALRWGLQSPKFSAACQPLRCPAAASMHQLPAQPRPLSSPSHGYSLPSLQPHVAPSPIPLRLAPRQQTQGSASPPGTQHCFQIPVQTSEGGTGKFRARFGKAAPTEAAPHHPCKLRMPPAR